MMRVCDENQGRWGSRQDALQAFPEMCRSVDRSPLAGALWLTSQDTHSSCTLPLAKGRKGPKQRFIF